jgi:tetratricopeptide (TPR) repeat protein
VFGTGEIERAKLIAEEETAKLVEVEDSAHVRLDLIKVRVSAQLRTEGDLREVAEEHARLADRVGDDSDVADSYISLSLYYLNSGPRGLARVMLESAASRARDAHDHLLLGRALVNLNADWTSDDARRALAIGQEATEACQITGILRWLSASGINVALASLAAGEWDMALEVCERDSFETFDLAWVRFVQTSIGQARGDERVARVDLESNHEDLALQGYLTALEAAELLSLGQSATRQIVEAATLCFRSMGVFDDFSLLWQFLSERAWRAGDREALAGLLELLERDSENRHPAGLRAQSALTRGRLLAGDGAPAAEVERELRTALTEAQAWRSDPTIATVQAELGTWLTREGRADEAEPLLDQARATYERLGATAWLTELDEQLAGVRT